MSYHRLDLFNNYCCLRTIPSTMKISYRDHQTSRMNEMITQTIVSDQESTQVLERKKKVCYYVYISTSFCRASHTFWIIFITQAQCSKQYFLFFDFRGFFVCFCFTLKLIELPMLESPIFPTILLTADRDSQYIPFTKILAWKAMQEASLRFWIGLTVNFLQWWLLNCLCLWGLFQCLI